MSLTLPWTRLSPFRESPEARSRKLLRHFLTKDQAKTLKRKGWFTVRAKSGREYQIRPDLRYSYITENDGGWCFLVYGPDYYYVPEADQALAAMLLIQADEALFRETANPSHAIMG